METKSLDVFRILESAGIDISKLRAEHSERSPQFFAYTVGDERIEIESTARSVMADIACLPIKIQESIFIALVRTLTRPGEQMILTGDKKERGARVVRLANEDTGTLDVERILATPSKVHRLLLTH